MKYQNTRHKEFKEAIAAMDVNDPPLQWSIPADIQPKSLQNTAHDCARALGYKVFVNVYKDNLYVIRIKK